MSDLFEGYVGIRLWEEQVVNDLLFTFILSALLFFALVFRFNYRACMKLFNDVIYIKERPSIFEKKFASDFFFRLFMIFQMLFLCSLFAFSCLHKTDNLPFDLTGKSIMGCIAGIFLILWVFYLFKQGLYILTGSVFSDPLKYKLWRNSYVAIMATWGIFLYIPVVWSVFWEAYPTIPIILFVLSYILCRFAVVYKTLRIFHNKNTGLLYISLYLCTQEILPLVFLHEGVTFLYNFIKTSTLWI